MFCVNCGTQLPDEANYCWKCGKPQKGGIATDEPRWETCEIEYADNGYYVAKAIGANGVFEAGRSQHIGTSAALLHVLDWWADRQKDSSERRKDVEVHNALIAQLVQDGWEPTGDKGEFWWSQRFRRRVK